MVAALQGNCFLGRRGARATHGVNSFLTPAPGLTGPKGPTSQRLPQGDSVAPSLSPDTAVDGPQAIDLERSAPSGLCIVTNIRVRRDAGRELRVNRTLCGLQAGLRSLNLPRGVLSLPHPAQTLP